MRTIKFRQPIFNRDGIFLEYHYWGFIGDGRFSGPETNWSTIERAHLTSQQFTGLYDKDGREIYEGDLLQWVNGRTLPVKFFEGCFVASREFTDDCLGAMTPSNAVIVGNIYENQEDK